MSMLTIRKTTSRKLSLLFLILFFFVLFLFIEYIYKIKTVIGWDTFDLHTVNFLFVADIFKSTGHLIYWNPLVLSGNPILSNLFNSSLFGPLDLLFIYLSKFIPALLLHNLLVILGPFISFISIYIFSTFVIKDKFYSFIASLIIIFLLFPPILGQIAFVYSFSYFFLAICLFEILLNNDKLMRHIFLMSVILSMFFAKGYFYFNLILAGFFCIYIFFRLKDGKNFFKIFCFLILLPGIFYIILHIEALYEWSSKYSELQGNLIVQEARMRSIVPAQKYYYNNLLDVVKRFFSILDPTWSSGLTKILSPFFLISIYPFFYTKKINKAFKIMLLSMLVFGLIFSSPCLVYLKNIPLLSSNRWGFTNLYFAIVAASFIIPFGIPDLVKNKIIFKIFCLIVVSYTCVDSVKKISRKKLNTKIFYNRRYNFKNYYVYRTLLHKKQLVYNDITWLTKKQNISHGYDNTVSEFYWRQKDLALNSLLVHYPVEVKNFTKNDTSFFKNDNLYIDNLMKQINDADGNTFFADNLKKNIHLSKNVKHQVVKVIFKPNLFRFSINGIKNTYLAFTQNFHNGWKCFVNNKEIPIIKLNKTFMGIFIKNKGKKMVEFRYSPKTLIVLKIWYLLIISILFFIYKSDLFSLYKNMQLKKGFKSDN